MRVVMEAAGRLLERFGFKSHRLKPQHDIIWFQHFHKAGGTSLINAAQSSGWQLYKPNLNGNPVSDDENFIPIWDWDCDTLQDWLLNRRRDGVSFICCEFGFSKAIFDIPDLNILQLAIMRRPKERLISNYLYDLQNGHTETINILEYIDGPPPFHSTGSQPFRKPDYYTRRVTGESGNAAREEAFSWLSRYDHIAFLEEPHTFMPLQKLIPGAGEHRANRTDQSSVSLRAGYQSVLDHDTELTDMVAGEQALYDRLRGRFS